MFGIVMVFGGNQIVDGIGLVGPRNDFKDIPFAIVDDNNARVGRDILVPQRINIVQKGQIAGEQKHRLIAGHGKPHGGRAAAIDARGATVAIYIVVLGEIEQLHIANGR
jgi:hypothetical protein